MVIGPRDPVRWFVARPPLMIATTATLRELAEMLTNEAVGMLLVERRGKATAVVSERDLVRGAAEGADLDNDRLADLMVDDVVTVNADVVVEDAARTMLDAQVRHLVIEDEGEWIGVVSLRDVAAALLPGTRRDRIAIPTL